MTSDAGSRYRPHQQDIGNGFGRGRHRAIQEKWTCSSIACSAATAELVTAFEVSKIADQKLAAS